MEWTLQVATHLCLYNTLYLPCFGGLGLNSLHLSYILSKLVFFYSIFWINSQLKPCLTKWREWQRQRVFLSKPLVCKFQGRKKRKRKSEVIPWITLSSLSISLYLGGEKNKGPGGTPLTPFLFSLQSNEVFYITGCL